MEAQKIGPYRIVRKLGEGGMGTVFEAIHEEIARTVAIKVLRAGESGDPEYTARLLNEARAVNIIRHRGIVGISDLGRLADGSPYIVMEYLDGETLRAAMRKRPPREAVLRLTRQMAGALIAAHEKGIIHRDLKPENVMVVADPDVQGGQRAIILDFGMAKLRAEQKHPETVEQHTDVRIPVGTAKYMSPEQAALERNLTERTDVYALGVMLYEMLGGAPPFSASTYALLLDMHRFSTPIPLDHLVPRIDRRISELCKNMLAKTPADRPSMEGVARVLDTLLSTESTVKKSTEKSKDETPSPISRRARRTEPMDQVEDSTLSRAASALLSDSETYQFSRVRETLRRAESSEVETQPSISSDELTAPSRRKKQQLERQGLLRWQVAVALLFVLLALAWAVAVALR